MIGLYKTELVHLRGPWSGPEELELATLEWVWWFNNYRLFGPLGHVPPVEYEADYHTRQAALTTPSTLTEISLR